MNSVSYKADGKVTSTEAVLERDLNERLNLNIPNLCGARRKALQGYVDGISRKKAKWDQQFICQLLDQPSGPLPQYWGVIESWLKKRLQRGRY